jgi:hypothetical protein
MTLDPNTFGSSNAAMILVEKLNRIDDPKLTKKVSAFLTYTFTGLNKLNGIDNDVWFKRFVILFRKHQLSRVDFHEDIDTYVKNIVTSTSKDWAAGIQV